MKNPLPIVFISLSVTLISLGVILSLNSENPYGYSIIGIGAALFILSIIMLYKLKKNKK